ncbi:MAG: enoyl-[acyl-carrier-protein] reductase FabK [Firmicutes bacterium]|nr:enoyl-[acyl-carrier-protein] reductase FabK [Bacillota bacterium]
MAFYTPLCRLLGSDYPILQGGMAWVATGELAAAVSKAGGLGIIGAGNAPADAVKKEIAKVKKTTAKPFGVNIMLLSPFVDDVVETVIAEKVPVVTTGAGNPGKYMPRFQEAGIKVIPVVSSVALARRLERQGVDALIAEGMEAGGHIGELTTMVLVPQVADAVNIPVVAAGGLVDGRGFVAALSLGAQGVQVGTRFACSRESTIHRNYKEKIMKAKDRDTIVTGRSTGYPVRVIKNRLTKELERMEKEGVLPAEIEKFASGKLRAAVCDGDMLYGSIMAGQSAAMVQKEESSAEIIEDILTGAQKVMKRLSLYKSDKFEPGGE